MMSTRSLLIAVLLVVCAGSVTTTQDGMGGQPAAKPRLRRVVTLYWYPSDHPVTANFDRQFRAALKRQPGAGIETYAEYFESARFPGEAQAQIMRDYLRQKYADRKIDVVLAWGSFPLQFLLKYRREVFADVPIVFYVGTLEAAKDFAEPDLAGIMNPDAYEKTLELALSLHPDTTHGFVISGTPERDKIVEREAAAQLGRFQDRLKITYLTDLPLDQLIATVKNLPHQSVILFCRQSQDDAGSALLPTDFLALISRSASAPVYAPWRALLGHGDVGGLIEDADAGAAKAAEIVGRIARGARPREIPFERVPKTPMFDARQLQRWGIRENRLPTGSVVLFREPTLWSQYRNYIVAVGVLLGLQSLLIVGLLVQRARRRRLENDLRESEQRFRVMADTAPVMIWRSNVDKACDFFNLPWLEFRGRTVQEEAGSGWADGVHPDDFEWCLTTYSSAFDERRPFQMEYRLQRADGEYRWVFGAGVPRFAPDGTFLGFIGSCFDITELRQAHEALRESERRYALATVAASVGVWDWNLETNEIWIDPLLKRKLGFDDVEIANHFDSWVQRVHPEDAARVRDDVLAHINGNTPFYETEHRKVHQDGSVRWFVTRGSAVRSADERVVRIIGTDTDITERKLAEAQLEEMRHELLRVSRVTLLAQFTASIAHEISQPLNAALLNAKACLRWLEDSAPSVETLRPALRDIAEAAKRATDVMSRNRELFQHHRVEKTLVDVNTIARDVIGLALTRLQQGRVTVETALDDNLPTVLGDRVGFQQVLLNLVLNSIEAMATVDAGSRRLRIQTRLTEPNLVQVTVRDAGVGLAGIDTRRLFTPFYTTKPTGTGVGLSISRLIVEAHGGKLWAEPHDGPGTSFSFAIPAATIESHEAASERVTADGRANAAVSSNATHTDHAA